MPLFAQSSEAEVTRAILAGFNRDLAAYAETEVIVIGGGPSGLTAARELALNGVKVVVIEHNNYIGGGFWIGGYLMNTITLRAPAQRVLDEIGCPYEAYSKNLYVTPGPHACSKLIAAAMDAGVKIQNMTSFQDIVMREQNRVGGVVINWTPVEALPHEITCVDPVALECELVIDATGHDAWVIKALEKRGLAKRIGEGGMWIEKSEDAVVEHTGVAYPGVIVAGMAVCSTYGLPRMGPTFGAMLLSGKRAAEEAMKVLGKTPKKPVFAWGEYGPRPSRDAKSWDAAGTGFGAKPSKAAKSRR
jgi:thiamine thiazole synthase